jgi:hypothetical protein
MVIVTHITYPTESVDEVAKRFLEAPQAPDFMTRRGPYIDASLKDGIIALSIWELEKTKLAEGQEFIANYMTNFFGIAGFRYEFKTFLEIQEALKTIGMG